MRRATWIAFVALVLVGWPSPVRAVGTCTTAQRAIGSIRTITITCTADAADGSVPDTALPKFEGRLFALVSNPGATAPTDNYDVTLENQHGYDVLQGVGANRDTTNTETAPIVYASSSVHVAVDEADTLTLKVANNSVNSATIVIVLYYALGA